MAKRAERTDKDPFLLIPGRPATTDDIKDVHAAQNFAIAKRRPVYFEIYGAPHSQSAGTPAGASLYFDGGAGVWITTVLSHAQILVDEQVLRFFVRSVFGSSEGGQIRLTVGGASPVTISVSDGDNGTTLTSDLDVLDTGTGVVAIQIEQKLVTGSPLNFIRYARLEGVVIAAADLPAPADD